MGKCFLNWNVSLMLLKVYFIRKKGQELTQNVRYECKLVKYIISQTWSKNNGRQFNCLPKIMFFKENNSKGWPHSHLYTCAHLRKMIHSLTDWGTIIFSKKTVFLLRSSAKEIQFYKQKNRIKKMAACKIIIIIFSCPAAENLWRMKVTGKQNQK